MARYKPIGNMLVFEPDPRNVEEVSVRELSRQTSAVLARVRAGGRAVVTKNGVPAAVVMDVDDAIGLCGLRLLSKREAERCSEKSWTIACERGSWLAGYVTWSIRTGVVRMPVAKGGSRAASP